MKNYIIRITVLIIVLLFFSMTIIRPQVSTRTYKSLRAALRNPLRVKILDLSSRIKVDCYSSRDRRSLRGIGRLKNLLILKLTYNCLKSLPREMGNLTRLKELHLGGANIGKIEVDFSRLKSLRKFVGQLPPGAEKLKQLRILRVSKRLPPDIGKLKNLRILGIYGVKSIPPQIGKLKNLRVLKLFSVQSLPPEIGNLHNLRVMILWNVKSLPPEIARLKKLRYIRSGGLPHGN